MLSVYGASFSSTLLYSFNVNTGEKYFISLGLNGAIPQILENTKDDFFSKVIVTLKEAADKCFDGIREVPCLTCPKKPEGSMFVMVKLNVSLLEDISDDLDFCMKLAKEESVIIVPAALEDGLARIKAFHQRHVRKQ
ncbi:tyrosine aminotransferase-like [Gossypium australe]|uniref:Tyrosine aminotransferase-like n=1 Tax=Gossypium australe TaxID=47621 RepID=A0A5B6X656_9ROSI|nr:tyrosine aminotransferase-like [Gossypium australe]